MSVSLLGLKIATVFGAVALMLPTEPQFWVACTVGITTIGSIVLQLLKNRQDVKMRQLDDERYERDRLTMICHQAELKAGVTNIRGDIAVNTALTSDVGARADAAYEAANNVNEKIASIATSPLVAVEVDTNETVHRIDSKM